MIVKKNGHASVRFASCLCCCVKHVFNEDSISGGRIVNKDMSNGAYQLAVLDDW